MIDPLLRPSVNRRSAENDAALYRVTQDLAEHGGDHRGAIRALLGRIDELEARVAELEHGPPVKLRKSAA
ncbi:MAG: hypothetical protein PHQ28_10060 [Mycobacterium sp.]|jgi:hypothetical protein|nr:hypothetical protein [Mycobacterium sp.]